MEGSGFGFNFGGDPEDIMRSLREFAEQQAESVQEAQREQFATLTLNTAVELTASAISEMNVSGAPEEQAIALRDAIGERHPVSLDEPGGSARVFRDGTPQLLNAVSDEVIAAASPGEAQPAAGGSHRERGAPPGPKRRAAAPAQQPRAH